MMIMIYLPRTSGGLCNNNCQEFCFFPICNVIPFSYPIENFIYTDLQDPCLPSQTMNIINFLNREMITWKKIFSLSGENDGSIQVAFEENKRVVYIRTSSLSIMWDWKMCHGMHYHTLPRITVYEEMLFCFANLPWCQSPSRKAFKSWGGLFNFAQLLLTFMLFIYLFFCAHTHMCRGDHQKQVTTGFLSESQEKDIFIGFVKLPNHQMMERCFTWTSLWDFAQVCHTLAVSSTD